MDSLSFYAICLTGPYIGNDQIYHSVICRLDSALIALSIDICYQLGEAILVICVGCRIVGINLL